mgnify:CR=1 FL=1
MKQAADLRRQGLSAEAAAQKVDLTAYRSSFPQIQGPGADASRHAADVCVDGRKGEEVILITSPAHPS